MMDKTKNFANRQAVSTYKKLRYMASANLIAAPLLIAAVGFLFDQKFQPSLSDYYHAHQNGDLPRTLFVMFLAFLGGVLIAYRGMDDKDNWIHNLAGICALAVAAFPMECDIHDHPFCVPSQLPPELHMPSAVLLFLGAVVSVFYSGGVRLTRALDRLKNPQIWKTRLNKIKGLSLTMMFIGMAVFVLHAVAKHWLDGFPWIFWVEYLGFCGFGIYWWRFMRFLDAVNLAPRSEPTAPSAQGAEIKEASGDGASFRGIAPSTTQRDVLP